MESLLFFQTIRSSKLIFIKEKWKG